MRGGIHQSEEKEQLALHLPNSPAEPPKEEARLALSEAPCACMKKAMLWVCKTKTFKKEKENIWGIIPKYLQAPSEGNQRGEHLTLARFPSSSITV